MFAEQMPNPANFDFVGRVFRPTGESTSVSGRYRLTARDEFYWDTWLSIDVDDDAFPSTDYYATLGNPKASCMIPSSIKTEDEVLTWWITLPVDRVEKNFPILLLRHENATGRQSYLAAGLCDFTHIEAAQ
jgi:hypothetical protein